MTKLILALLKTEGNVVIEGPERRQPETRSYKLGGLREIRAFTAGKTVARAAEPLDDHVRFVFTDGSALLVVTAGPVGYYAEPALS